MTTPSVHCEARLRGISKKHGKDGDWAQITLQVQPQDLPDALWQAPLGSIFMVAFARVGDDGVAVKQEVAKPKATARFNTLPRVQQAGIKCKDAAFQAWATSMETGWACNDEASTRAFVLDQCDVPARRELDASPDSQRRWDNLLARFNEDTGRTTEARG